MEGRVEADAYNHTGRRLIGYSMNDDYKFDLAHLEMVKDLTITQEEDAFMI